MCITWENIRIVRRTSRTESCDCQPVTRVRTPTSSVKPQYQQRGEMRLQQTELLLHGRTVTLRTVAVRRICCWQKVQLFCSSEESFVTQWFGFAVISRCKDSRQAHRAATQASTEAVYRGMGQQNTYEALHFFPGICMFITCGSAHL